MTLTEIGTYLAWGGTAITAVIWAVRQEGRINSLDQRTNMLQDYLDHMDGKLDRLIERRP